MCEHWAELNAQHYIYAVAAFLELPYSADGDVICNMSYIYGHGLCLASGICAQYQAERPVEPMLSHDVPSRRLSKISVDLFQLDGKYKPDLNKQLHHLNTFLTL